MTADRHLRPAARYPVDDVQQLVTQMFSSWPHAFDPPLWRLEDPPKSVLVDLAVAIPTAAPHGFGRNKVPMRIKSGGLRLTDQVPGLLYAWARCADSSWLGIAEFTIATGNRHGSIPVLQMCRGEALSPTR